MNRIVGTCGNCGGPVVVPVAWMGTLPPIPACNECGAEVRKPYGPTLKMAWVNKPKEGE